MELVVKMNKMWLLFFLTENTKYKHATVRSIICYSDNKGCISGDDIKMMVGKGLNMYCPIYASI